MIRAFLVGCPRSGTTLTQSVLGAHPEVWTFPETHFFTFTAPRRARELGLVRPGARRVLPMLSAAGLAFRPPRVGPTPLPDPRSASWTRGFVAEADRVAQAAGRSAWLEKTPRHLHYLREIDRDVPSPQIVHVIRDPVATVSSLHLVRTEHRDVWASRRADGAPSLDSCIARWTQDVAISHACIGRPGHSFVWYDTVVEDPYRVLEALATRLRLPADESVLRAALADRAAVGSRVSLAHEPWKAGVSGDIVRRSDSGHGLGAADVALVESRTRQAAATLDDFPFVGSRV